MLRPAHVSVLVGALVLAACATTDPALIRESGLHRDLGTVYLGRGELEMAIREYRAAVASYDGDAETHFALGEAYRRKGEFVACEQHFRRALALDPTKLDTRLNLGALYLQQERWAEAIEENRILVADPTFLNPARALVNLGWAQYKSKDFEGAKRSLRRALAVDPSNYRAHVNLAILGVRGRRFRPALRVRDCRAREATARVLRPRGGRGPVPGGDGARQARGARERGPAAPDRLEAGG
jgi:Tfp pilus assembly protein PilF